MQALVDQAAQVLDRCRAKSWRIATAESCTGGLIAACLTAVAGSSDVVDRGFVTYSNAAKTDLLGVAADLIAAHGAVSQPVARAMAQGALSRSLAQIAIAVTGVAGPGGGSPGKPVGLVWFALATHQGVQTESHVFPGDRTAVREATVARSLELIAKATQDG